MSRESFQAQLMMDTTAEMQRWGERPVVLHLDITTTIAICGALQLALRHPQFKDRPSAKNVREFVMGIERQIPTEFLALHRLIQLGFHQRFDV